MKNDKETENNSEEKKETISIPKQGHQIMLAAQSLFFRKLILEHRKKEAEENKE